MDRLAERVLSSEERAIARAISCVENSETDSEHLIKALFPHTGTARIIGITGPAGAGKSTLTDRLVTEFVAMNKKVGVVAVDPTSPFSGGAILGDRIRMRNIAALPGVFVRSMATRGVMGGLNRACIDVVDILDASGMDLVIIETVGVGQDEVDIVQVSDLNLVVLVPGMGDDIQAMKAGLMEIADIFVINKADREGVDRLASQLTYLNQLAEREIPIVETVATSGDGIKDLITHIQTVLHYFDDSARVKKHREKRADFRLNKLLQGLFLEKCLAAAGHAMYNELVHQVAQREMDPYTASSKILAEFGNNNGC